MVIEETKISGLLVIHSKQLMDDRGGFIKIFNNEVFEKNKIKFKIKESYYTVSQKDVIRGMHFQIPPHEHEKLVYVSNGKIIDVILDIRKSSATYGKFLSYELTDNNIFLFIPKGCAHGFRANENNTIVTYLQSSCYEPSYDRGIKFNSFGFEWDVKNPIISRRDMRFPEFKIYKTPFL